MAETLALLQQMAAEMGIDITDVDEGMMEEENRRFEESWEHELIIKLFIYRYNRLRLAAISQT